MQENNENIIKEFLAKLKENKELNERLQTKIISLKDVQNESKAKDVFLKELVSSAKSLGYSLEKSDFENYFNSQNAELSDDILEQASGGRGNFWSWVAVGLGTVAGGIGMIAGAFHGPGGLFGGGNSGGKTSTANRPAYVQQIDANRNRSKSVERTAGNTGAGEQNKNADQKISELNKNTGNRRISSSGQKKSFNLNNSRRSSNPGRFAVQRVEQGPNIRATEASTAEKQGKEELLNKAFSLARMNKKDAKQENKKDIEAVKNIKKVVAEKKAKDAKAPAPQEIKKVDTEEKLKKLNDLNKKTEEIKNKLINLDEKISNSCKWEDFSKIDKQDLNDFVKNVDALKDIVKQVEKLKEDPGVKEKAKELLNSINGSIGKSNEDKTSWGGKSEKISQYLKNKAPKEEKKEDKKEEKKDEKKDEKKEDKKDEKKEDKKDEKKDEKKEGKKEEKKDAEDIGAGLETLEEINKKIEELGKDKKFAGQIKKLKEKKLLLLQTQYENEKATVGTALQDFKNEKDDIEKVTKKFPDLKKASEKVIKTLDDIVNTTRDLSKGDENTKASQEKTQYQQQLNAAIESVDGIKATYKSNYAKALKKLEEERDKVDKEKGDIDRTDVKNIPIDQLKEKINKSIEIAKKYEEIAKKAQKNLSEKIESNLQVTNGVKNDGITKLKQECEKLVKKYTNNVDSLDENEKKDNIVVLSQAEIEKRLSDFKTKAEQAVDGISKEDGEFKKLEKAMTEAGEAFKGEKNEETKEEKAKTYSDAYDKVIEDLTKKQNTVKDYEEALNKAGKGDKIEAKKLLETVTKKIEEVERGKITDKTIKDQEYAKLKKDYEDKLKVVEQKAKEIDGKIVAIGNMKVDNIENAKSKLSEINNLKRMIEDYKTIIAVDVTGILNKIETLEVADTKTLIDDLKKQPEVTKYFERYAELCKGIDKDYLSKVDAKYKNDITSKKAAYEKSLKTVEDNEKNNKLTKKMYEDAIKDCNAFLETKRLELEDYKAVLEDYVKSGLDEKSLEEVIKNKEKEISDLEGKLKDLDSKNIMAGFEESYNNLKFDDTLKNINKNEQNAKKSNDIFKRFNDKGAKLLYEAAKATYKETFKTDEQQQSKDALLLKRIISEYESIRGKVEQISSQNQISQKDLQEQKKSTNEFVKDKLKKEKIVEAMKDIVNNVDAKKLQQLLDDIKKEEEKIDGLKNLSEDQKNEVKNILKERLKEIAQEIDAPGKLLNAFKKINKTSPGEIGGLKFDEIQKLLDTGNEVDEGCLVAFSKELQTNDYDKITNSEKLIRSLLETNKLLVELQGRLLGEKNGVVFDNDKLNTFASERVEAKLNKALKDLEKFTELRKKGDNMATYKVPNLWTDQKMSNHDRAKIAYDYFMKLDNSEGERDKAITALLKSAVGAEKSKTFQQFAATRELLVLGLLEYCKDNTNDKGQVQMYLTMYQSGGRSEERLKNLKGLLNIRDKVYGTSTNEQLKARSSDFAYVQKIAKQNNNNVDTLFAQYIQDKNTSLTRVVK